MYSIATCKKNTSHFTNKSLVFGNREHLGTQVTALKEMLNPSGNKNTSREEQNKIFFFQKLME